MRSAAAAGIFRGHFHGSAIGPWRGPRAAVQPIIFASVILLYPGFHCLGLMTLLSILFSAARADIARGAIPAGLIFLAIASGLTIVAVAAHFTGGSVASAISTAVTDGLLATATLFWLAITFEALFKKEGLGFGDVQIAGVIGLFCGYGGATSAFFLGAICALCTCGFHLFISGKTAQLRLGRQFPFTPYIFAGTALQIFLRLDRRWWPL